MTYQRDPNRSRNRLRREDGSWSILPFILGAVVLFLGAYLLFGPSDRAGTTVRESSNAERMRQTAPTPPTDQQVPARTPTQPTPSQPK